MSEESAREATEEASNVSNNDGKSKGAVNPPAISDPNYVEQAKRLDTDVAGHEASFTDVDKSAANVRPKADEQIAANYADHQGPQDLEAPEKDQPDTSPEALAPAKPKRASRAKKADTDK